MASVGGLTWAGEARPEPRCKERRCSRLQSIERPKRVSELEVLFLLRESLGAKSILNAAVHFRLLYGKVVCPSGPFPELPPRPSPLPACSSTSGTFVMTDLSDHCPTLCSPGGSNRAGRELACAEGAPGEEQDWGGVRWGRGRAGLPLTYSPPPSLIPRLGGHRQNQLGSEAQKEGRATL